MMTNTETCNSRVLDEASKVIDHEKRGLYDPRYEHDNCGIGSIVNIKGNKTHDTVSGALDIVEKLEHRAGKDAEGKTGDGVGILLQISHKFFKKAVKPLGFELGDERDYGIGMFFFPQDELKRNRAKKMFEVIIEKEGLELLGWRKVPTEPEILGHKALECHTSCRHLLKDLRRLRKDLILTANSMLHAVCLNRVTMTHMLFHFQAVL